MPLQGYELGRGIVAEQVGPLAQVAGWAGNAAIVAIGWRLSRTPRSARALVAELGWVAGFGGLATSLRQAMARSAQDVSSEAADEDVSVLDQARRQGQARARAIVSAALSTANARLEGAYGEIDGAIHAEAARRLELVGRELAHS